MFVTNFKITYYLVNIVALAHNVILFWDFHLVAYYIQLIFRGEMSPPSENPTVLSKNSCYILPWDLHTPVELIHSFIKVLLNVYYAQDTWEVN